MACHGGLLCGERMTCRVGYGLSRWPAVRRLYDLPCGGLRRPYGLRRGYDLPCGGRMACRGGLSRVPVWPVRRVPVWPVWPGWPAQPVWPGWPASRRHGLPLTLLGLALLYANQMGAPWIVGPSLASRQGCGLSWGWYRMRFTPV